MGDVYNSLIDDNIVVPYLGIKLHIGGHYNCGINGAVDEDIFMYTGGPKHRRTLPGVIKILEPMKPSLNYFECEIISGSETPEIGIGLGDLQYPLNDMPGWNCNGIGYHSDDGNLYYQRGHGEEYGPTCTIGDRIGCGVDFESDSSSCINIFFTKNGEQVGDFIRIKKPTGGLYPLVGMCQKGERVRYLGHCHYLPKGIKPTIKGMIIQSSQLFVFSIVSITVLL